MAGTQDIFTTTVEGQPPSTKYITFSVESTEDDELPGMRYCRLWIGNDDLTGWANADLALNARDAINRIDGIEEDYLALRNATETLLLVLGLTAIKYQGQLDVFQEAVDMVKKVLKAHQPTPHKEPRDGK